MEKIIDVIGKLQEVCMQVYGRTFSVLPKFNNRLTSTAGRAFLESGVLEFSSKLYSENEEQFLADTVPHEFAHIVAYRIFGDKGHGAGWKSVMNTFGLAATRCHTYAIDRKQRKTYTYHCDCRTHEVSPQRQAWINKGKVYKCTSCNSIIRKV